MNNSPENIQFHFFEQFKEAGIESINLKKEKDIPSLIITSGKPHFSTKNPQSENLYQIGKSGHICSMVANRYAFLEIPLNFPKFEFRIQEREGKLTIFDSLRRRFLVLTPEEWVRQHMVSYLVQYEGFPKSLFALEKGLKYNTLQKRFDILVLDRKGLPFLLLECKAPEVELSTKTLEQIATYNTQIDAPYLGITNGRQHLFFGRQDNSPKYTQIKAVPQIQP